MHNPANPSRYTFEYPDEAGYPDGSGTLSQDQIVLIDEVIDETHTPEFDFYVSNDERTGSYGAIVGDAQVAWLTYSLASHDRIVLMDTAVLPRFRNQGVASELIRRVLDDVRAQEKTATVMCPIVRTFIERNPQYADLLDSGHPGVSRSSGWSPANTADPDHSREQR